MAETYLAQTITAAGSRSPYDENAKRLLADKQVLAWILKYSVKEFQDMEIMDIISCIGDTVEVGIRPVDLGLSNLGGLEGAGTVDSVPGEGTITYDIRFAAYHKKMEMKFLINLEAQKSSEPGKLGYHLENRIVYYLSRMISAQKLTEFFHSDYDNLKHVRSIWICMDSDKDGDSIEEISLVRKDVFGGAESLWEMGLMKGIIIRIRSREGVEVSKNRLIAMLEELFFEKSVEEKKRVLTEKYGMIMTAELEGRIQLMCNWSEAMAEIWMEEGMEKGIKQGIEQGIEKGIEQGINQQLAKLIQIKKEKGKSVTQIAEELEETEARIEEVIKNMGL